AQLCHGEVCIDITSMSLAARSGSQDKLLAVPDWRSSTRFSEQERLALAYAEAATQTPPAWDDALRSAMAAHVDARAL
ncbi:carboxymuconolactone decarboxylase family protein, partial [Klebsiella pneumoniae]|uniref:carboxymuconolactone decarboxylase family protein n=1 Tax=Klebsiella pneumoniae TaxID=573 RepID=UPI002747FD68|nr:carboxymuconolactone decarboxylase family protein [Klebsiella pneumoniae]